jgi:DNA-binding MarR family transcriptional regulator
MTELPSAALALARNGFINVRQTGSDTWRVALTESGQALVRQLTGETPSRKLP